MNAHSQPVVAVVGHIDHGKTSLLDYIRKSRIAERETGGITQRISAYEIEHTTTEGEKRAITFIDTPGHEAFREMRKRGAGAADIALLVVAADDGVKPQTREAWEAIKEAETPFIVVFTKADKETANVDRAKESVLTAGIYLEGLGGSVPWIAVSSKTGAGIPELLDLIALVSDLEDISCDTEAPARATIIESLRDSKAGISATIIVRSGTLEVGTFAVAGGAWAPLRAIEDARGAKVKTLSCGKPARIAGFSAEPEVGAELTIVGTKREAEAIAENTATGGTEHVFSPSDETKVSIRLILKADSLGSLEALRYELKKVPVETAELLIASEGVGPISENDVKQLVGFENALILGFGVSADASAEDLAERQGVMIETRDIIYELTEWLTKEVARMAPGEPEKEVLGRAKILKNFSKTGTKFVIGARVEEGELKRGASVSIERRGVHVGSGKILNIQSQKADVDRVGAGVEFGGQVDTKADLVPGDSIQITAVKHDKR